jgi:phosphoglycolate phosphatase-like HAD superfamily hydrolase
MPGRKALILDRDGTVVLWEQMFLACVSDACESAGVAVPPTETVLSYEFWDHLGRDRLVIGGMPVSIDVDSIPHRYLRAHGQPVPGALDAVAEIAAAGVTVAVVSSWTGTRATRALLGAWGLDGAVALVLTADDLGDDDPGDAAGRKRLVVRQALRDIGGGPVWMAGDSASDIAAGKEIGATCVGVLTGNGSRESALMSAAGADYVISSLRRLPAVMLDDASSGGCRRAGLEETLRRRPEA